MNTIEFIREIKNEGKALTVYHLQKICWEEGNDNGNPLSKDDIDGFYFDIDTAKQAMKDAADSTQPEFGVPSPDGRGTLNVATRAAVRLAGSWRDDPKGWKM